MVDSFEITSDAKMVKTKMKGTELDSTKVLILIDHKDKVIYLWRGKNAGLFEKLMGTRVAAKLSHKYPDYRIRPIGEGHEPTIFFKVIGK
jgi:hypothetical protein